MRLVPTHLLLLGPLSPGALVGVSGHGYLASPRSRNIAAFQDGVDNVDNDAFKTRSTPRRDWCSHCVNRGGVCGMGEERNWSYDYNRQISVLVSRWRAPISSLDVPRGGRINSFARPHSDRARRSVDLPSLRSRATRCRSRCRRPTSKDRRLPSR